MRYFIFILLYTKILAFDSEENSIDEKAVSCEYSDTDWHPLNTRLFTCNIFTQAINSPDFKILHESPESENVEGLQFNDNKNLHYLPNNIAEVFPNLKGLIVSGTYLGSLSVNDLKGLTKLKYISFENSDLKIIEDDTFKDLSELEQLHLSDSNLRIIEKNAFRGLTSLKELHIGGNKLTSLEPETFEGLSSLTSLTLELNHLEYIDENLFSTNTKLEDIWLNKNRIVGLPFKVIENLPSFSYLDVQENPCIDSTYDQDTLDDLKEILNENCTAKPPARKIHDKQMKATEIIEEIFEESIHDDSRNEYNIDGDIDTGLFTQYIKFIKSPDEIDEGAPINDVFSKTVECQAVNQYWKLSNTDLSTCIIENQAINSKGFTIISTDGINGSELKAMSFAKNKYIKFLPDNIGKFAPNLIEFSARNASIDVITSKNFDGLKNLKSLNLADNKIKFIDPDAFDDLVSLEELDLSGNELETLDDNIFTKLKKLKTLRIGSNQLHAIHPNLFKNLRNLMNVSLSHQQIFDLNQNTFKQNTKLQNIWLNSNKLKSLNPNMFDKLKDLQYVDMRDNKCIDTFYGRLKFPQMKKEIHEKCGKNYKLKMGTKTENNTKKNKTEKKKKEKLPKQSSSMSDSSEEENEVVCEYEDIFWPHSNKVLKTCVINEPIDNPNFFISANPIAATEFVNSDSIQAISFRNNKNAKYLPKNLFEVFPNLVEFSAADADLVELDPQSFKGLSELKFLDLSGNKLTHINGESFNDLTSLEELILDNNDIEEFDEETFIHTKVLKKLKTKGNKLKRIEVAWFEEMPELEDVSFDISADVQILKNTFENNPNLKSVEWNGIQYDENLNPVDNIETTTEIVNMEIVCGYKEIEDEETGEKIETCEIGEDQMIENSDYSIRPSPQNNRVKKFVISNNRNIKFLPKHLGETFPQLKEITIEDTEIDIINKDDFKNLPHLRTLKLIRNKIHTIENEIFDDLPQLKELDLSGNSIESIGDGAFYKLSNLESLNLGRNKISSLNQNSLKSMRKLKVISLPGNEIRMLDRYIFRHNPDLEEIDFNGNLIESLTPKTFDKLKMLRRINLKGNKCLDIDFDSSLLSELKNEILKSCKASSKLKEISCEWEDSDDIVNDITTCAIGDDIEIDEPGYKITVDESMIDPFHIKEFVMKNNEKIKYMPENVGEIFLNLEDLQVTHTSIMDLPENTFENMKFVKNVDFSDNKIASIQPNSFNGLDTVSKLNLSNNNIEELDVGPFLKIPTLNKLDISGNKLKILPKKLIEMYPELSETYSVRDVELPKEVTCSDINYDHSHRLFTCKVNNQVIDSPKYLLNMPQNLNIEQFEFIGDVNVKYLPKNIHKLFPNVKNLTIHETSIENIPESLKDFDNLESVDLSNNKIKSIQSKDFNNLPRLKNLNLKNNEIEDIDESSFDLPSLEWLDLEDNKISSISLKTFDKIPKIKWISLENNDIEIDSSDEESDELYFVQKEVNCDFVNLKFETDEESTENFYTCIIKNQSIIDEDYKIKPDTHDSIVKSIIIENNTDVEFLPNNIGDEFPNLEKISIKNTKVSKVPSDLFKNLKNLKVLDLSSNEINQLDPEMLNDSPSLKEVNFSGNKIEELPRDIFKNTSKLEVIKLSNNKLSELDPELFENLPNLKELFVDGNNFPEEIDEKSFVNNPLMKIITDNSTNFSSENEIECENEYYEWKFIDYDKTDVTPIFTCFIKNQPISRENTKIKSSSNDPGIQGLKIEDSQDVKHLPENIGDLFPNLQYLSLKNTSISEIPRETLTKLRKLKTLDLSKSDIKDIDPEILNNMPMLKELILDRKQIDNLSKNAFDKLPKWNIINSEKYDRDYEIMENLPEIDENVPEIDSEIKTSMSEPSINTTTLEQLNEVECILENSDWTSFVKDNDEVTNLYTCLIVDQPINNKNTKIKTTKQDDYINVLKIQNNKDVKFVPENIGELFPNLQKLSIQNTSISDIPKEILKDLYNLNSLDLSNNEIKALDPEQFSDLQSLEKLDLSYNIIKLIPDDIFKNTHELKVVNLDNNELNNLEPKIFENTPGLKVLSIKDNNIPKNFNENFFDIIPLLKIIQFEELEIPTVNLITETTISSITEIIHPLTTETPKELIDDIIITPQNEITTTQLSVNKFNIRKSGKTTTTPKPLSKLVDCELIYEASEFEEKNVIKCDLAGEEIDDTEVSLKKHPNGRDVQILKIDNNKDIKYLPDNIAQIFPNLNGISAKNSAIDSILPGDFDDLNNLQYLVLSGNDIKTIEPETFEGLKNLKNLDLSSNDIEFIDEDGLGNLPSLSTLNLKDNQLTFIHPKLFQGLPNLESLNIEGNDISNLHENIFDENPKLKEMKHSIKGLVIPVIKKTTQKPSIKKIFSTTGKSNLLQKTTTEKVYDFHTTTATSKKPHYPLEVECEYYNIYWVVSDEELFSCDLSNAVINNPNYVIKASPKNKRVKGLSFVDNKNIMYFPQNIDEVFPNLVEISVYNTSIKHIPKNVLSNLPKLRALNLMESDLSTIDPNAFNDLHSLEHLELSDNKISGLHPDIFKNVPQLKSINLNENNLIYLDPTIFENLSDLRNISLEGNEITEVDRKLFGNNYELQNVWLNDNKINKIDSTIFDGKRALEYVDLRQNDCIDQFFEGYALESIRKTLRNKCQAPNDKRRKTTITTTTTEKINYGMTRYGTTSVTRKPSRPKIDEPRIVTTLRTLHPYEPYTQRSLQTTTLKSYDYRKFSQIWNIPTQRTIERTPSESPTEYISQRSRYTSSGPQYFINQQRHEGSNLIGKEIKCSFNYRAFPGTRPEIYTCFINDQNIDGPEYLIKPMPQNRFVNGVAIDDNKKVKFLPQNLGKIFPNLHHLSAKQNSIDDIPNLKNLENIKTLDLSDNKLAIIDPEIFKNLPLLEDLNLSGNQIPLIINGTFDNLPNLKNVDLSRNNINELSPDIFSKLPELRKVILDNNKITELPETIFSKNPKLETINISGNKIQTINPQAFENLPKLSEVNLEENICINGIYKSGTFHAMKSDFMRNCAPEDYFPSSYEEVTEKIMPITPVERSKPNSIECNYGKTYSSSINDFLPSCIIDENKVISDPIWEIKGMPANKRIKRFMIYDNNNIEKFPMNLGESFPQLSDIVVKDVPIKSLSPNDLKNLSNLKTIIITGSSIKVLESKTFNGAPIVEDIELSSNNIRHIDDDAFEGIPQLKNLDLSRNKIPKISNNVFKLLPELKTLKLSGNDLQSIDAELFKGNPKLYKVNIDENNLRSIDPDAFDRLPHLIDINLNKNDCIDRSFGTSNMHLLRKIVSEHCQPYETLKNELRTCRKEIENCIPRHNEIEFREKESLKDMLHKSNNKIQLLNIQINKLRNALNTEKESLKKEIQNTVTLEKELDSMKRSCVKVDENHNMIIELNCDYNEPETGKYSCNARNLKIKTENSTIESPKGNHKRGKRNTDVNSLFISNQNVNYLPNGISNHFPYLIELMIDKSGLKKINQLPLRNLPYLNKLIINGNDIHQIEPNALNALPQLEYLDLSQNNIMDVPLKFLDGLPKLKLLNLNDNALLSLPQNIIPNVNNLKTFTVGNNNLNFIDPRVFKHLNGAEVIDFTNNRCIDKKFNGNDDDASADGNDYMSFIGFVSMKCTNDVDSGEDGFCKGRKV